MIKNGCQVKFFNLGIIVKLIGHLTKFEMFIQMDDKCNSAKGSHHNDIMVNINGLSCSQQSYVNKLISDFMVNLNGILSKLKMLNIINGLMVN